MGYIISNQNRFYAATELKYGAAQAVDATNRFPATHIKAYLATEVVRRLDKTGTRSYQGALPSGRIQTSFDVRSYLSTWSGVGEPGYGPLFHAACGARPVQWNGLAVASLIDAKTISFAEPHGLQAGSAISFGGEIRFVVSAIDALMIQFNAPFTKPLVLGALLGPTVTYRLASELPSFTLYNYWNAQSGMSRLLAGCGVDEMTLSINGDIHEFDFVGPGSDLVDGLSPTNNAAGLATFPPEPALDAYVGSAVPGHLGQVWLGSLPAQFLTLTAARIRLKNNLELRQNEFGLTRPAALIPGDRIVTATFSLFVQDDTQTKSLYRVARERLPFPMMLQLGAQQGQMMGIFLPQVVAEAPSYNDEGNRLSWNFESNVAQGTSDDELSIAFA